MSHDERFASLDLIAQAELVRRGEVSPPELVDAAIDRIEALDPQLNAVVATVYDAARAEAAAAAGRSRDDRARGAADARPLAGTPFLVKDLGAAMAGVPETMGSRALRTNIPREDSRLVRAYREAGLIILGRTNTPEFGNHSTTEPELFGPTRNPWDPSLTVGGSSGGSAAAVAAGMVAAAHGGDGAGSLRIPASCCGVFGLKPSRGRVSRAPAGEEVGGLTTRHAITRSVRDSAALLDVAAAPVPGDPYRAPTPERPFLAEVGRDPGRLRVGWSAQPPLDVEVDAECIDAVKDAAALLASLGHDVEEAAPTFDASVLVGPLATIWSVGNLVDVEFCERVLGRPPRDDELELSTRELAAYGRTRSALDVVDAVAAFGTATRQFAGFFETYDLWLTPTLARRPEPLGVLNQAAGSALAWQRFDDAFNPWNPIANISGQPAMSVPLHWTADGIPIGVLFTGRWGEEGLLLRLAGQLEAERPWAGRRPPIHALASSVAAGSAAPGSVASGSVG
ncbi:MAG TPA: amidase [Candidatus Limnocylindrales bacterium]|nr:amidase [Candidatus Limnocylindrales bacterium]